MIINKFRKFPENTKTLLVYIIVGLLIILLRLPYFSWPLISDEGGYAYTAEWWFNGVPLYSDQLWFDRPQGIFIAYKIGMLILGGSTESIRLWGSLWAAGTGLFVLAIGSLLIDRKLGILSALIYAVFSTLPQIEGFTANAEVFSLFPATISIYLILRNRPSWAGFFASISFLLKPSGISAILFICVWLAINRSNLRSWVMFLITLIPLPLLCFIHGISTAGFNNYMYAIAGFRIDLIDDSPWERFTNGWGSTFLCWFPLSIFGILGFRDQDRRTQRIFEIWLITSLIGMALGAHWNWHYFILLTPPLSFAAAIGVLWTIKQQNRVIKIGIISILIPSILSMLVFSVVPPKTGSWVMYRRIDYKIEDSVSSYIKSHTHTNDQIYVSTTGASIYFLADRLGSTSNIFRSFLIYRQGEEKKLFESIKQKEPVYVVLFELPPKTIDPNGLFLKTLNENYYIETEFENIPIYHRNDH